MIGKIRHIAQFSSVLSLLWMFWGTATYAQTFDNLWKQVENAEKKGQPQTAKTVAEKIYRKAETEGNFPWLVKSYSQIVYLNTDISADSFKVNIERVEKMLEGKEGTCDAAVLHCILGAAYNQMRYSFYGDSETVENYQELSSMHYAKAMENKELLADTQSKTYVPLVTLQTDSKLYGNDMLSVIAMFIAKNKNTDNDALYFMYDMLSAFYKERGNRNASLLMQLKALEKQRYVKDRTQRISGEKYRTKLLELAEENKDIEAGADVYYELLHNCPGTEQEKLDLARKAIQAYPNSVYTAQFKYHEAEALQPQLHVYGEGGYAIGMPCPIHITNKNIEQSVLTLTDKQTGKVVERRTVKHKKSVDTQTDTIYMTVPKAGKYIFKAESKGKSGKCEINATSLRVFATILPDQTLQCTVADNVTGIPVAGCKVKAEYWDNQNRKSRFKESYTDSLGTVNLGTNNWRTVCASRNSLDMTETAYIGYFNATGNETEQARLVMDVFTDRSIYRPGQTARAMVLAYRKEGDKFNVAKQEEISLTLHDANGKEIATKKVTSNDMGTADADFVIPKGRLNGNYFITTSNGGRCYLMVEEYKRPTFGVEMTMDGEQEESAEYSFGDSLSIKGCAMTFSGVEVQNARVKYKVEYSNRYFWYRFHGGGRQTEAEGELTTDEAGKFVVPVFLNENHLDDDNCVLEYHITAEVTDMGGETQTTEYTLPVSKKGFGLSINIPQNIDKDSIPEWKVTANNLRGKEVETKGKWKLYRIYDKKSGAEGRTTTRGNYEYMQVAEGDFVSGTPVECPEMKSMQPGSYVMRVSATDSRQNLIETEAEFVLFDLHAERMEVMKDWLYADTAEFGLDSAANIYFMPKHNDTYLYYYVFSNKKLVKKGHRESAGTLQKFHFDYKEEYGESLTLLLFYAKNGKAYSYRKNITLKAPDKKLTLKWKTFRDKLQPGQKEEWTLSISNSEGLPLSAELMAVLYDGSLDKLNKHNWDLEVSTERKTPMVCLSQTSGNYFNAVYVTFPMAKFNLKARSFSSLENAFGYEYDNIRFSHSISIRGTAGGLRNMATMKMADYATAQATADNGAVLDAVVEEASVENDAEEMPDQTQPLRSNFTETAFFYPHLMTDENEEVSISFTLPESLTEWKFIGLAHTEDVDYGKITADIIARKEFMVQPNMPRFVRVGDHTSIAAKIINKTEDAVSGTALFELLDPETEKTVYKANKKFSVGKNGTVSVEFDFNVSDKYPLLVCRISAGNKTFSDGERNYLPVLTNKKYVTETIPFFIDSAGTKAINLSEMFNGGSESATDKRMTIEYSDNPGWTVIQALESMTESNNNDAISLSAALYANYAIKKIGKDNPDIQKAIEKWKNSGVTAQSNLEKNEELKYILLQESPWMIEAENETEQMMKLADLFDQNIMEGRIVSGMEKLSKLQNADGSWSWFNGMDGNEYVTITVMEHLALLDNLTAGSDHTIHEIVLKGFKYLDKKELDKYRRMKKGNQKVRASETTMRYLYISSLVAHGLNNDVKQMQQEYIGHIGQDINALTIYGRANIALVLNAYGKKTAAKDFVKSLREYTVYKEGMGRYYDTDRALYSWMDYRIPTHIAAMRAMRTMSDDFSDTKEYLNNMTLWLIRQKQAQSWDNPINTVHAVNELLQADKNAGLHNAAEAGFTLNGKQLDRNGGTAKGKEQSVSVQPDGYIKIAVPKKMLGKKKNELTITKHSEGISWGAVYGQYLEDFDRLTDSQGSLTIHRKIYREDNVDGKKVWKELSEQDTLAVGDKVRIRHIITADRDMDFVQVHSQFAACMEPIQALSGYRNMAGTGIGGGNSGCYVAMHDASADFFFDIFRKGTSTVDMEMFVNRKGVYNSGVATVQCVYAPEYSGHSGSHRTEIK
ncbi:MAG: MG2 domain-containing protein [Bacteroides sp.]|nr:MG2 domain-containing protein [Roseburia sp.]MCM1346859.1 MG2 domain-containing protein [Bacteroides sp.]MCM1420043.1 MG2 domain-containing protein [Bacteroides sp.]